MARITLKAGGKREKVSKERAVDTVQRWRIEAKGNQVTGIDISCLSWSLEAFNVIKPFLQEVASTVKYANLADIIASLMTDEGLAVIEGVVEVFRAAPLVDIDLSDNALGLRGMERIKALLTGTPLQRLYLTNCGFSAESMVHLKDCMAANDNTMGATLKELVLDRNMMGTKGAQEVGEILSKCNLEYFSYLGCRIQEGTLFLANGIKLMAENAAKPSLIRLDIDDGNFGEAEPAYLPLAEGLKRCSQLRHLDLTDAKLEIEGLTCVVDALTAAGVKLTHLGLGQCLICFVILGGAVGRTCKLLL
jgi:Ran GTPase-activating protein 1